MRQRSKLIVWILVIVAGVLLALLGWQFIRYRASLRFLPEGMTVAGMDIGGKSIDQALTDLEVALAQEVVITYQDETLYLTPTNVTFQFDPDGTRTVIEDALAERGTLDGFIGYVMGNSIETPTLQPAATYSNEMLTSFLTLAAQQYDRPSESAVPLPEVLSFRAGLPGYQMDVEASRQRVAAALLSAVDRHAELVVVVEDAPALEMAQLEAMLTTLVDNFYGVAAVFVKDLQTGDELGINAEVAFSGMSVLKIAVALETYRSLDVAPNLTQTQLLTWTITESENHTANALIADVVGNGDPFQGVETLTASMTRLGLLNTFMAAPYDEETLPYAIVTPANSRTDVSTEPDPYMQTTAQDVGLLLEMLYQCAEGGGTLRLIYPDSVTPQECQAMLGMMRQNRIDSMIEVGLPPDTLLAHKQGLISTTHADAGIAFTPQGDFVLVIFLYTPTWLDWEISNPLIGDVATATYNYFNPAE